MFGETGAVTAQINSERITRDSSVQVDRQEQNREPEVEQQPQEFSDVTSFSAEALALAKNVTAASGSAERQEAESGGQRQQEVERTALQSVDIRV